MPSDQGCNSLAGHRDACPSPLSLQRWCSPLLPHLLSIDIWPRKGRRKGKRKNTQSLMESHRYYPIREHTHTYPCTHTRSVRGVENSRFTPTRRFSAASCYSTAVHPSFEFLRPFFFCSSSFLPRVLLSSPKAPV